MNSLHKTLLMVLMATLSPAVSAEATPPATPLTSQATPGVRLTIQPVICVRNLKTDTCKVDFTISWKSPLQSDYCLYNDRVEHPLKCWENTNAGVYSEQREVKQSFFYWLSHNQNSIKLVQTEFSVLDIRSPQRRKNRKRRHIWSVL